MTADAFQALSGFVARTAGEARDLAAMLDVARDGAPFDRNSDFHLTASALIVDASTRQVLLRFHARHQAWMQVGGHGDPGETAPYHVALREAIEESGLDDLRSFPDPGAAEVIQAVVVDVPANDLEPAHRHGDVRYVLSTEHPDRIVAESDETPLRWCDLDSASALVEEENLIELFSRVAPLFDAI
jgi:8-oxo-dGTP pyrophosphatase MutT (NUDIX family)